MKHLLSIEDLDADQIEELMVLADSFVEVTQRQIPKVPALRGRTVVSLFFEESTRTRMSFETAARRLSADVANFVAASSSLAKGESVRDTVETILAMGADALVVRHSCPGVPHQVARWGNTPVINAGDGAHQHPTQALLDTYTLRHRFGSVAGLRVVIVGDISHSRAARSLVGALSALGASVVLVAPPTLLPTTVESWGVEVSGDLDSELAAADAVYLLRLQQERMRQALLPSLREYTARFGLSVERAARLKPSTVVMHPGPMIRGVEIASEVAEAPAALVREQVRFGVAVRMAVLWSLLGSGAPLGRGAENPPGEADEPRTAEEAARG